MGLLSDKEVMVLLMVMSSDVYSLRMKFIDVGP